MGIPLALLYSKTVNQTKCHRCALLDFCLQGFPVLNAHVVSLINKMGFLKQWVSQKVDFSSQSSHCVIIKMPKNSFGDESEFPAHPKVSIINLLFNFVSTFYFEKIYSEKFQDIAFSSGTPCIKTSMKIACLTMNVSLWSRTNHAPLHHDFVVKFIQNVLKCFKLLSWVWHG